MDTMITGVCSWRRSLIEQGISTAEAGVELTEGQKKVIEDAKLKDLKAKNYLFRKPLIDQSWRPF